MTGRPRTPKPKPGAPVHGCTGKSAFTEFAEADRRAKRIRERTGDALAAYYCRHCQKYHVGGLEQRGLERRARAAKRRLKAIVEGEAGT